MKKRSVLRRNLVYSLAFGLLMGALFPLYASLFVSFASPSSLAAFTTGCLGAGILVGIAAYRINTVSLVRLARGVNEAVAAVARGDTAVLEELPVESDDLMGQLVGNIRESLVRFSRAREAVSGAGIEAAGFGEDLQKAIETTLGAASLLRSTVLAVESSASDLDGRNREMQREFDTLHKATLLSVSHVIELYSSVTDFGSSVIAQTGSLGTVIDAAGRIESAVGSGGALRGGENLSALTAALEDRVRETVDTASGTFSLISDSLASIAALAERTNVLAINAAIESARLGKDGMGFRIISGNIRSLAEEVNALTDRVKSVVDRGAEDIRSVTGALSGAMDTQRDLIETLRLCVTELNEANLDISGEGGRIEEYRGQIGTLLSDIKENMHQLKDDVGRSRVLFDSVMQASTKIHAGIATLALKSAEIESTEQAVQTSFETFITHMNSLKQAAGSNP